MEKTLDEIFLSGCEGQKTPQSFLQAKADQLIEGEERATGAWLSSYETVLETAKNSMFSDLENQIEQKIVTTVSKFMPQDKVLPHAQHFSRNLLENIADKDMNQYNLQQVHEKISNLVQNTNFFENAFLETARQGYIGDNDFLFYGITKSEFESFVTTQTDAKQVASALSDYVKKIEQRIITSDDRITRCTNEVLQLERKIKKADTERIDILKQRKQLRQDIKQNPQNKTLLETLEQSKQKETALVGEISAMSKQLKPLKEEISRKTSDIKHQIALRDEFSKLANDISLENGFTPDMQ